MSVGHNPVTMSGFSCPGFQANSLLQHTYYMQWPPVHFLWQMDHFLVNHRPNKSFEAIICDEFSYMFEFRLCKKSLKISTKPRLSEEITVRDEDEVGDEDGEERDNTGTWTCDDGKIGSFCHSKHVCAVDAWVCFLVVFGVDGPSSFSTCALAAAAESWCIFGVLQWVFWWVCLKMS